MKQHLVIADAVAWKSESPAATRSQCAKKLSMLSTMAMYCSVVIVPWFLSHLTQSSLMGVAASSVQPKALVATLHDSTESQLRPPSQDTPLTLEIASFVHSPPTHLRPPPQDELLTKAPASIPQSPKIQLQPSLQDELLTKALGLVRHSQRKLLEYYHGDEHILNKAPYALAEEDSALASKMAKTIIRSVSLLKNNFQYRCSWDFCHCRTRHLPRSCVACWSRKASAKVVVSSGCQRLCAERSRRSYWT